MPWSAPRCLRLLCIGLLLGAGCLPVFAGPTPGSARPLLPPPVRALLANRYPAWTVVQEEDLSPDDRGLWRASPYRRKDHPGIAAGHFLQAHQTSYAVLLLSRREGKRYNLLVLAAPIRRHWELAVLKPRWEVNPFTSTVVWRMPPGRYSRWDQTGRVTIGLDGVVNECIGCSSVMYYRWRGRWRQITLTD